ncbi:Uncharacterised protein [Bacillus freudenreichii]|nr:Uncharacterised protein [Bacillus freudenreichii]
MFKVVVTGQLSVSKSTALQSGAWIRKLYNNLPMLLRKTCEVDFFLE